MKCDSLPAELRHALVERTLLAQLHTPSPAAEIVQCCSYASLLLPVFCTPYPLPVKMSVLTVNIMYNNVHCCSIILCFSTLWLKLRPPLSTFIMASKCAKYFARKTVFYQLFINKNNFDVVLVSEILEFIYYLFRKEVLLLVGKLTTNILASRGAAHAITPLA